jgi:hypothetical protein
VVGGADERHGISTVVIGVVRLAVDQGACARHRDDPGSHTMSRAIGQAIDRFDNDGEVTRCAPDSAPMGLADMAVLDGLAS